MSRARVKRTSHGSWVACAGVPAWTALLYTSRGVFAENDILLAGMQPVVRSRFISQDDLRGGRWEAAIRALLTASEPSENMATNGASVVADAILGVVDEDTKPRNHE